MCVASSHHKTEGSAANPNAQPTQTTHKGGGAKGLGGGPPKQCQCALAGPRRRREISLKSYYISMTLPLGGCRDRGYRPRSGGQARPLSCSCSPMRERCAQFLALGQVLGLDVQITHDTKDCGLKSVGWFFVLPRQGTSTQEVGNYIRAKLPG